MPELVISLATIGGATIAAVASVLGINKMQKNGSLKNGTVKIDEYQFQLLINTLSGVGSKVDGVSDHVAEAVLDTRRQHEDLKEVLKEAKAG